MLPPSTHRWGLVEAAAFTSNPLAYTRRRAARYGPIFASRFLSYPSLIAATEAAQRQVLRDEIATFPWGYHRFGTPLFGQGLILLNGATHDQHRRLMQPMMHRSHFADYLAVMQDALDALFARWGDDGTVDLHHHLRTVTFTMATSILVGMGPGTDQETLHRLFDQMQTGTLAAWRSAFPPGTRWSRALRARSRLDAALQAFIRGTAGSLPRGCVGHAHRCRGRGWRRLHRCPARR